MVVAHHEQVSPSLCKDRLGLSRLETILIDRFHVGARACVPHDDSDAVDRFGPRWRELLEPTDRGPGEPLPEMLVAEYPPFMVAEDADCARLLEQVDRLVGARRHAEVDRVARTEDEIDVELRELLERAPEGTGIAMDVCEKGETGHKGIIDEPRTMRCLAKGMLGLVSSSLV